MKGTARGAYRDKFPLKRVFEFARLFNWPKVSPLFTMKYFLKSFALVQSFLEIEFDIIRFAGKNHSFESRFYLAIGLTLTDVPLTVIYFY